MLALLMAASVAARVAPAPASVTAIGKWRETTAISARADGRSPAGARAGVCGMATASTPGTAPSGGCSGARDVTACRRLVRLVA